MTDLSAEIEDISWASLLVGMRFICRALKIMGIREDRYRENTYYDRRI